jgi:hypothetical protein
MLITKTNNHDYMKKYLFAIALITLLIGCNTKEKAALQTKVDSLTYQLNIHMDAEKSLDEVGTLIDSIDLSRKALQLKMKEGTPYGDYVQRLKNINTYIHQTEAKLEALEKSSDNSSKISQTSIRRLKADLSKRSAEVVDLELKLAKEHEQSIIMWTKLNSKDSLLSIKDQIIKLNERDIASLERLFNNTQDENKIVVANLYFAQGQALETAANRTHFAPRKKKETRREALELYKLSLSLGNTEAQKAIDELEKKLD